MARTLLDHWRESLENCGPFAVPSKVWRFLVEFYAETAKGIDFPPPSFQTLSLDSVQLLRALDDVAYELEVEEGLAALELDLDVGSRGPECEVERAIGVASTHVEAGAILGLP